MDNRLIISAYGSHNAAVSMYYAGTYTVVEVERWLNIKNAGLTFYLTSRNMQLVFDEICQYLLNQTDRSDVDVYIHGYMGNIKPKFKVAKTISCDHHMAHAAGAFYQSPYNKSLVFTYDGGGDGGFFNVYLADRDSKIVLLDKFNQDLGFPYMVLADYLKDIKKESLSIGNLVYAGKLMGLCSYGRVREEWLPHFDEFYDTFNYTGDSFIGGAEARHKALPKLFKAIGVEDFDLETSSFEGQFAWDIAATTQKAFERQFFKYAQPYIDEYNLPICLSGGCALNVLLNTILLEQRGGDVFVPPNTNDCGISIGALLWHLAPSEQVDLTYSGLPILDDNRFSEYMENGTFELIQNVDAEYIARAVANGKIIGIIQGNSEHGSRALGNRSIICNPIQGMKDTLNHKVKNREWYRPFAPIVRTEDAHNYFNFHGTESRHMVFVAEVKDEWKDILPAITHEDGTGRLQTVSRNQNEFIYDIITNLEPLTGHGVILNTSFNVNGKPILTRLSDALHILQTSKLDAVYYKGYLIVRKGETSHLVVTTETPQAITRPLPNSTIYIPAFDENLKAKLPQYVRQIDEALALPDTKVVILCDAPSKSLLSRLTTARVSVHTISPHRHYYSRVICDVYPDIKTTKQFAPLIRLLWAKEAMREHLSGYHIVLNGVSEECISTNKLQSILEMLSSDSWESSVSIVSGHASIEATSQFDEDFFRRKYRASPTIVPDGNIIAGQTEAMDWLLTNYEGVLNWYLSLGKTGNESDFLTISMMENIERFEIVTL